MDYQLRQQIGQMIFAGVPVADEVDDKTYHLIRAYDIANFCLFGHNIVSIPQTCALCNELAELCAGCNGVMPLIIADQEGGAVSRAKMEGALFPGAMALAAAYDHKEDGAEIANSIGHLGGLVIKALGINTNDAPVLDVNINPSNPIIGTRSFSDDPRVVSKFGIAQLKGMKEAGVLSVVKHYPGHGGVSTDSHLNLPENKATRETLAQTEWKPFKEAFEAGAEALMTCHVRFPNIDPDMPATLSPKIMTQLLRVEHRFRGLAITDCLEMDAIRSKWSPGEAAILAVEAGCDMLTFSHSFEGPMEAAKALFDAVTSGRIPRRRIEASVRRIMAAKERYRLLRHRPKDPEVAKKFAENQDMIQFFGNVSFLSIT
ncbi:MAG: glycoside hydrolase family 3 protein, partial [Clostridiales bacterium]|nr:glycoside hydrolase family 3 protein [Clostridiales bacterium]